MAITHKQSIYIATLIINEMVCAANKIKTLDDPKMKEFYEEYFEALEALQIEIQGIKDETNH